MDRTTQEALIGRIMTDKTFRDAILKDPKGTLESNGYKAPAGLVEALSNIDAKTVEEMASNFEVKAIQGSST